MAKQIGSLGTVDQVTIGPRTFTDLTNLIPVYGFTEGTNTNSTFRKANTASSYAPSAVTYVIKAVQIMNMDGSQNTFISLGYCDNDLGQDSATAPTNPVYWFTNSTTVCNIGPTTTNTPSLVNQIPINFTVPAGKFPFYKGAGGAQVERVILFGYEV